ncbi:hypothetical protein HKD37_20G057708 [Glycine soja]
MLPQTCIPFSALTSDASATPLIPNLPLLSLPFVFYFRFTFPANFPQPLFKFLFLLLQFTKTLRSALNPRPSALTSITHLPFMFFPDPKAMVSHPFEKSLDWRGCSKV